MHTTALPPPLLSTVIPNSQERPGSHISTLFASPLAGAISVNPFWAKVLVPGLSPGRTELGNEVTSRVLATSDAMSSASQQAGTGTTAIKVTAKDARTCLLNADVIAKTTEMPNAGIFGCGGAGQRSRSWTRP